MISANPPPGISISQSSRIELENGATALLESIDDLRTSLTGRPELLELIPDVVIYYNAVHYALQHDQFYEGGSPTDLETAASFLEKGLDRARALGRGDAPWTRQTGLVVRGYISKIDDSVQPYGLEIPEDYDFDSEKPGRLDIWYHGRNNRLSELRFIRDRESAPGKFKPLGGIVLHPYGRYCNANKFAGEIDTFEAIESVSRHYSIDPDRIAVRGFSMGGAATWHMATHHAGRWAAAAPGAGFAETAVYANVENKDPPPAWYEKSLFQLYDATEYAANLIHCPTIAYSGSEDKQKQAADIMAEYMNKEGLDLLHVIGAGMGHKYDDASIAAIDQQMDRWLAEPKDRFPKKIRFTTRTLRYNRMLWLTVDALERHWRRSDVRAEILDGGRIKFETENIRGFSISFPVDANPFHGQKSPEAIINGNRIELPVTVSNGAVQLSFRKDAEIWRTHPSHRQPILQKSPGLQGPIDDAFLSRFVFVLPSSRSSSPEFQKWIESESKEAISQWWRQFRGQAIVKRDTEITANDIANSNLVLWGDPSSNELLGRIIDQLPFDWDEEFFEILGQRYNASTAAPVMIYPNPLNPDRYVVLNTGFTFAAFSSGTNSLQVPKLPDWGVVDLSVPRDRKYPGGVLDAGFFDEFWRFKEKTD